MHNYGQKPAYDVTVRANAVRKRLRGVVARAGVLTRIATLRANA
jgi:hypothetical protein